MSYLKHTIWICDYYWCHLRDTYACTGMCDKYYSNIGTVLVPVDHTGTEVAKRRHLGEPSASPAPVFGGYLHFIAAVARQLYHSECCVHKAPSNNRVMIYLRRKTPMIRSLPSPPRARRRGRKQIY